MKSKKLWHSIILCSLLWLYQAWAAADPALPDWLTQVQQNKYKKPEAMLQLAKQHETEFGRWPLEVQAVWLSEIASMYEVLGRYREQMAMAERGLALTAEQKTPTRVELLYSMGFALETQREYALANEYYQKGMLLAETLQNEKLIIQGLTNLAAMLSEENESPKALDMLKQAYDRAVKLNDIEMLALVQAELGLMYTMLAIDDEGQQFLKESFRLFDQLGWAKSKLMVWYNLASTYGFLNKQEQALAIFDQMLKVSMEQEDPVSLYFAYMGLANTNRRLKKLDAAITYIEKAETYLPSLQSTFQISEHHFIKAKIYRSLGQISLAMQQVDLAAEQLDEGKNTSDKFYALHFDDLRARLYADAGNYEKAYRTLDKFFEAYIDLQDNKRDMDVQKLRLSFDAERQEARNQLLEKDIELQALKLQEVERNRQIQWLWLAIFACTSLVLFILLLWQWTRRRAQTPQS
ncbi:MAG: tetratricopeptide repeat protein [Rheinheimera sp.]